MSSRRIAQGDGTVHPPTAGGAQGGIAAGAGDRGDAGTARGSTTAPCDDDALARRVAAVLRAALRYPRLARRRHLEGTAIVELRWKPSIGAPQARLVASSGSRVLDEAALDAARRAHWPPLAARCLQGRAPLRVPIRFRLRP